MNRGGALYLGQMTSGRSHDEEYWLCVDKSSILSIIDELMLLSVSAVLMLM